jgi:hypothetical protein
LMAGSHQQNEAVACRVGADANPDKAEE